MGVARYILVDYDNLSKRKQSVVANLWVNVKTCISTLGKATNFFTDVPDMSEVRVRLYGGWYGLDSLRTPLAVELVSLIDRSPMQLVMAKDLPKLNVRIELADSLLSMPDKTLYGTFRINEMDGLKLCDKASFCGCTEGERSRKYLREYFVSRLCLECKRPVGNIFRHEGQKLVDSMIMCDSLFVANQKTMVAVVSSDDDMVPILFQLAIEHPNNIIQMLTTDKPSSAYDSCYQHIKPSGLSVVAWR